MVTSPVDILSGNPNIVNPEFINKVTSDIVTNMDIIPSNNENIILNYGL